VCGRRGGLQLLWLRLLGCEGVWGCATPVAVPAVSGRACSPLFGVWVCRMPGFRIHTLPLLTDHLAGYSM
jgi:hypothetical protein